jgi:mRNA interferase HigB
MGKCCIFAKRDWMRVISKRILKEFWKLHPDCKGQLQSWFSEAEKADWRSPDDIKKDYPSASILKSKKVVFNIKGNKYRLIVRINYDYGLVWIRFIGTHGDYSKINAEEV